MNYTLTRAGRTTHLKIILVALVAATVVVTVGRNVRTRDVATARGSSDSLGVKVGHPTYANRQASTVR
jgi:hypothetical protein